GPEPFGLFPAPLERVHEMGKLHVRGEGLKRLVEPARGGANGLARDLDLRQELAVEQHERVEQVEEDRAIPHSKGFLCPYPSSNPCHKRTPVAPAFQQRLTGSSSTFPGKSTRPISRSLVTPPRSRMSCRSPRISIVSPSSSSALAFQSC